MALTPYTGEEVDAPKLTPYRGEEVTPTTPSRLRRFVADPLISATRGAIALPEAAVGLADLVTGGAAGAAAERVGFRPKQAKEVLDSLYSPEQQQANAEVAQAKGFLNTVGASFRNPSTIAHSVIESAPLMLGGAGVARGLLRAAPKMTPLVAGAIGEGIVSAGSTAEAIRQETGDLKGMKAPIAAASGVATVALGAGAGRLARRFGIVDVDTLLAGGAAPTKKGIAKAVAGGIAIEGGFEEAPQSAQEQAAMNLATGKPLGQGVPEAAAKGAVTGGAMGGGFNAAAAALGVGSAPKKIKEDLDAIQDLPDDEQKAAIQAVAAELPGEVATSFEVEALERLDAGEAAVTPEVREQLEAAQAAPTREALLEAVTESLAVDENPLEILQQKEATKVAEALKPSVAPAETPALTRANLWIKEGRTVIKEGKSPDAEVAAHLDDLGYTLVPGERADKTAGGNVARREWLVKEKEPVTPLIAAEAAAAAPQGLTPLADGERRLAYADNPNIVVERRGDQIAVADVKNKKGLGIATIKDGKVTGWVEGREPATVEERSQLSGIISEHMGGEATRFSRSPFFSKLEQVVTSKMGGRMPVAQLLSMLKKNDVTDAEIDTAIGAIRDEGGTATKQQVLDEIRANSVEFEDVVLGEPKGFEASEYARKAAKKYGRESDKWPDEVWDEYQELVAKPNTSPPTQFGYGKLIEPGAVEGSYREMFVTAPDTTNGKRPITETDLPDGLRVSDGVNSFVVKGNVGKFIVQLEKYPAERGAFRNVFSRLDNAIEYAVAKLEAEQQYNIRWQDGHDQYNSVSNPIVRIRFNTREADGKTVLFVEEMQGPSDANQKKMPDYLRKRIYDIGTKRVLAYAKENGFDGVAWTTGAMQAARYDLSKQVDQIFYRKLKNGKIEIDAAKDGENVLSHKADTLADLEPVIGKEITRKIGENVGMTAEDNGRVWGNLSGLDLKVGGEGLTTLYDRTLPALFKKYGKEAVSSVNVNNTDDRPLYMDQKYSGPDATIEQVRVAHKASQASGPNIWESPITGERMGYPLNRVANEQGLRGMLREMEDDTPFSTAIVMHGADPEIFGGKIESIQKPSTATVPFIPITDKTAATYPSFNRGAGQGLPQASIEAHLAPIIKGLKIPVAVVSTASEVPGLKTDVKFNGVFHRGKIYLNAETLTSLKEAEDILLRHEIRHAGLRSLLGREGLDKLLAKAWGDLNSGVREFAKERGIDTKTKEGKLEATEEYIVELAKTDAKHPLWDRFVEVFKAALRRLGFSLKYSDAELRSLVARAGEAVKHREAVETTATKFSRVLSEDPKPFVEHLSTQVARRVLSDISGNIWRNIMAVDRTIEMARSMPLYAPIKDLLARYVVVRKSKAAATDEPLNYGRNLEKAFDKAFDRKAQDVFNELVAKATLYELHANGRDSGWTETSWKESGKEEKHGLTLGQARSEIAGLYGQLNDEQKVVHRKIIDHMRVLFDKLAEIELAPLKEAFGKEAFDKAATLRVTEANRAELEAKHGADTVSLAEQIQARTRSELRGDYAPLSRFGNHIVRTLDADGKRIKLQAFESKKKADEAIASIQAAGLTAEYDLLAEANKVVVNIPEAFLNKMRRAAEARGISGGALEDLMDDFAAARVQTMPSTSLAGTGLHREGVEGYDPDMLRSYAAYVNKAGHAIAYAKYGRENEQLFRDMDKAIKDYQKEAGWKPHAVERMSSLRDTLYKLDKTHDVERINEMVKALGKTSFIWYLSSPSIWAVQWSQPFLITVPKLAVRHGFTRALGAYVAEAKEYLAGKFSDEKIDAFNVAHENAGERLFALIEEERKAPAERRPGLRRAMKALYDGFAPAEQKLLILKVLGLQGVLDISSSHELMDLITGAGDGRKFMNKAISKAAFFMQKSEAGSRRAAAVSAFRLAMEKGGDFAKANDYTADIISDTLGDFTSENRPWLLRGNSGRLFGQFRFFQIHMLGKTVQLAKDAYQEDGWGERRKELSYMLAMSLSLAGAAGTPLSMLVSNPATSAVLAAIGLAFGDPDDPWDPEQEAKQFVLEAMGDEAGQAVLYGLPALLGVDVHKRIGLGGIGNIVSGEPPPGMTATERAQWYAGRLAGPTFGIISDTMRAGDAVAEGDLVEAFKMSSPKVIKDAMKAMHLAEKGAVGAGGRVMIQPEDVSPASIALQLLGVNPMEVALAQEERREIAALSTALRQRRSLLLKRVTEATLEGDFDAREEALGSINEWGLKQPGLRISQGELLGALKKGRAARAGTLTKREALVQGMLKE